MKFYLGTANFNIKYGIGEHKVNNYEIKKILEFCSKKKINLFDTSIEYKNLEVIKKIKKIIKEPKIFLKLKLIRDEKIINIKQSINYISEVIKKFSKIYCLMLHDLNDLKCKNFDTFFEALLSFKNNGFKKIGLSIYEPSDLNIIYKKKLYFDYIQIPYSIFNQNFTNLNTKKLRSSGVKFLARSIFLQGIIFNNEKIRSRLYLKKKLLQIKSVYNYSLSFIFLNFVRNTKWLSGIVFGVNDQNNLLEIFKHFHSKNKLLFNKKNFRIKSKKIIDPRKWS
jgi:aryl-alcohol dehydrogenase-like predicted oxidoreductase